jgi:multiple sugar transport system permease protein
MLAWCITAVWNRHLPTSRSFRYPGIVTSAVFGFIQSWNEFLFALILTNKDAVTLTVGLMGLHTDKGILWEHMAAAGMLIMVPIFILSLPIKEYFVEGLTMGAVK